MSTNEDPVSDENEEHEAGAVTHIQEISGGTLNHPILGNQYKTVNKTYFHTTVRRKIDHDSFKVTETGTFTLRPILEVSENDPINAESRVFRGKLSSKFVAINEVVVKIDSNNERSKREASLVMKIPYHKNIVKPLFADTFSYRGQQSIYIAFEKCDTNMHEYVSSQLLACVPYDPDKYLSFGYQVTSGVDFLHKHGIASRDLKPSNLLLTENSSVVKICDFGMSKQVMPGQEFAAPSILRPGTDGWRAPEVLLHEPHDPMISDTYSLALNLFYLWSYGKHAFGNDPDSWNHYIKHGINLDLSQMLIQNSVEANQLLKSMLEREPSKRPSTREVMEHSVFHQISSSRNRVTESQICDVVESALTLITDSDETELRTFTNDKPEQVTALGFSIKELAKAIKTVCNHNDLEIVPKWKTSPRNNITNYPFQDNLYLNSIEVEPQTLSGNNQDGDESKPAEQTVETKPKVIDAPQTIQNVPTVTQQNNVEAEYTSSVSLLSKEFLVAIVGTYGYSELRLARMFQNLISRLYDSNANCTPEYEAKIHIVTYTGYSSPPESQDILKLQNILSEMSSSYGEITGIIFAYGDGAEIVKLALDECKIKEVTPKELRIKALNNLAIFNLHGWPPITQDRAQIVENIRLTEDETTAAGKIEEILREKDGTLIKRISFHTKHHARGLKNYLEDDRILKYILKALKQDHESECLQDSNNLPLPPTQLGSDGTRKELTARALYDFTAVHQDDITLEKGDIITNIDPAKTDGSWWHGTCLGRMGFFPSNYVELL
uniref:microtubule-associated serine/threonine-protein kinase 4-like isoform X1 n=1 Tax=Styela clava TaxID=7725 RepID=UPI00193A246C|nr:microtubule-associated serine/threonine-protein kinase 4-like isoform X1 [Styela clava]